ncbi:MAG: MarR family transcriptional regulator [Phycisphaerae bacterium]
MGIEEMADDIFELIKIASTARARARSGNPEELTEAEFLTLDVLTQQASLSVGEIQERVGVLPAQMSRIIRSLENKGDDAFVRCSINPQDRRRINVAIAPKGRNAHRAYRALRRSFAIDILHSLSPGDREQFMRILSDIHAGISKRLSEM